MRFPVRFSARPGRLPQTRFADGGADRGEGEGFQPAGVARFKASMVAGGIPV